MLFRDQRVTETLDINHITQRPATFDQGGSTFRSKTSFDLKILMKRDSKCHDEVFNISRIVKKAYIFVQLDKPIYKPGDAVKFRIISLNNTLQPFRPDNINVRLYNPRGFSVQQRSDLTNVNRLGLFNETFSLPDIAEEGKWSLFIEINTNGASNTTKTFTVQKYTLPFYEFKIHTRPKIGFDEKILTVEVEAVYSFGGFVAGDVSIEATTTASNSVKQIFINNMQSVTFSLADDLHLKTLAEFIIVNVTATFKDHLGLFTQVKTKLVEVYPERACSLDVIVFRNFTEGAAFELNVIGKDFDGNVITDSSSYVEVKFRSSNAECQKAYSTNEFFENSVASFKMTNLTACGENIIVDVKYENCETSFKVNQDDNVVEKLFLRHYPIA